jgi:hypothetical protein
MGSLRKFPDPAVCRVQHITEDLFECEADDADHCPCALAFGLGYYCKHPDRCNNFKNVSEKQLPEGEKS